MKDQNIDESEPRAPLHSGLLYPLRVATEDEDLNGTIKCQAKKQKSIEHQDHLANLKAFLVLFFSDVFNFS